MKRFSKFLVFLLAVTFCASMAYGFIPTAGIKTNFDGIANQYGAVGYGDNGNKYRYVLNNTVTTMEVGWSAWYDLTNNDYTVTTWETGANLERYAGVWFCDTFGSTYIQPATYGWIQISGFCNYASVEGTTDITAGDLLIGKVTSEVASYLIKGRAAITSLTAVSGEAVLTTVSPLPVACVAFATNNKGTSSIEVRSAF